MLEGPLGDATEVYDRQVTTTGGYRTETPKIQIESVIRPKPEVQMYVEEIRDGEVNLLAKCLGDGVESSVLASLSASECRQLAATLERAAEYADRQSDPGGKADGSER